MMRGLRERDSVHCCRMKTLGWIAVLLAAVGACSCASVQEGDGATVEVNYQAPEQFTDMSMTYPGHGADEGYLQELRRHIERAAARQIPAGYTLALTITDVDMAGDFEPHRGPNLTDVRIIKRIYPPRINLTYRLTDPSGAVRSEGERQLRNPAFDWNVSPIDREDSLRHEKALLDDFLRDLAKEVR